MKAMTYIAKVLPDGHLSLPEEIKEKMGLTANSRVKVVLEREAQRERALEAFGIWSERADIKSGVDYVAEIRAGSKTACKNLFHWCHLSIHEKRN